MRMRPRRRRMFIYRAAVICNRGIFCSNKRTCEYIIQNTHYNSTIRPAGISNTSIVYSIWLGICSIKYYMIFRRYNKSHESFDTAVRLQWKYIWKLSWCYIVFRFWTNGMRVGFTNLNVTLGWIEKYCWERVSITILFFI